MIAGSVIGGIIGASALLAAAGIFAKTQRDRATRALHLFANAVQKHLKLQGMDNFKTEQGRKFVRLMEEDMTQALMPYGFNVEDMHPKALDVLAKNIACEVKNKITRSTTFFGYNETQLDQLEHRIEDIAQAVAQYKDIDQIGSSHVGKDSEIELREFIPTFNLSAKNYENV